MNLKSYFQKCFYPLVFLLSLLIIPLAGRSQAGSLDSSFGNQGKVILSLDTFGDVCRALAIQDDAKILAGGFSLSSFTSPSFLLLRYTPDGMLDPNFGDGGIVRTSIESGSEGRALLIQDDGKIILGGSSKRFINLARYTKDGSLDSSFGVDGKVITDFEGFYNEKCMAMVFQDDGKIIVGGYGQHQSNDRPHFLLARYLMDGNLDSSFGTNGSRFAGIGMGHAVQIQQDGKILLGGTSDFDFALLRFNQDGSVDSSFGNNGQVIGVDGSGNAMLIQEDGKILLGGTSKSVFVLLRYTENGSLDQSFGSNGKVFGRAGTGSSISLQPDGKILFGGSNNSSFLLSRYVSNGNLDSSFGLDGTASIPIGISGNAANALMLQKDGNMILGGFSHNGAKRDIALVRFQGDVSVGLDDPCCEKLDMSIYPNPFNSRTTIRINRPIKEAELWVYDAIGQDVLHIKHTEGEEIQLQRGDLEMGVYFVVVWVNNQRILTGRIVVRDLGTF